MLKNNLCTGKNKKLVDRKIKNSFCNVQGMEKLKHEYETKNIEIVHNSAMIIKYIDQQTILRRHAFTISSFSC